MEKNCPTDDAIREFWVWFAAKSELIREAYKCGNFTWIDDEVSPRVEAIAREMTWEMGPYCDPHDAMVLSPTTRENIPIAKRAVALAPTLDGWCFLPARPPKELLSLEFVVDGESVNADTWRYRLTSYNRGEFVDIEILFDRANAPPTEQDVTFCELVVEALIGEEMRLDRVGYIDSRQVDDVSAIEKAAPLSNLKKHLALVLSPTDSAK